MAGLECIAQLRGTSFKSPPVPWFSSWLCETLFDKFLKASLTCADWELPKGVFWQSPLFHTTSLSLLPQHSYPAYIHLYFTVILSKGFLSRSLNLVIAALSLRKIWFWLSTNTRDYESKAFYRLPMSSEVMWEVSLDELFQPAFPTYNLQNELYWFVPWETCHLLRSLMGKAANVSFINSLFPLIGEKRRIKSSLRVIKETWIKFQSLWEECFREPETSWILLYVTFQSKLFCPLFSQHTLSSFTGCHNTWRPRVKGLKKTIDL